MIASWTTYDLILSVAQISDLVSLLQFPFMQRAIAGALLMGLLGGLLGCFVTLQQLSFLAML